MSVVSGQSEGTVELVPSGIAVYYQSKPKRLYRIAEHGDSYYAEGLDLLESAQAEDSVLWREVPSVTSVLGVLDKGGGLLWWAQGVGVAGALELAREHGLDHSVDAMVDLLTQNQKTINHVKNKAGDRGQSVHDAFEAWARTGHKPDPSIYPDEEKGYIEGLLAFLADVPSIEPLACEVLVASVEHGYAGRYDIRFRTSQEHEVVVKRTKTKVTKRVLAPGVFLGDLKTSKGIYASHARQLEAYEQASIESGYEPTDARGILHVSADGTYEFVRSWATIEDFLCVLRVWQSDQAMKGRK